MEKQSLTYQGFDLGIECTKSNDCTCEFCSSCKLVIDILASVLAIACENESVEHFNFLCMNFDGLLQAAREQLEKDEKVLH